MSLKLYIPVDIHHQVRIHTYYITNVWMQLSAAGVSKLAHHCPSLEVLDISKCFDVDDHAIQDVLQVRSYVQQLYLTHVRTYV